MTSKNVLVTGSSRGIGRAIALKFAQMGHNVIINGLSNPQKLSTLKGAIEKFGVRCISFTGDIGNYDAVKELFNTVHSQLGNIDVIINNAGISIVGLFQDTTPDVWNKVITTNLNGAYNTCHLGVPDMISNKWGSIVNISSVWGLVGSSCEVAYSASKGAINSFTMALAKELAPSNIRVNALALGAIDTEMNSFLSEEEMDALKDEIPAGRLGSIEEAANLVYTIAMDHTYLTGQVIKMDGGWI